MPLFEMSANIQDGDSGGRKRSHDEFSHDVIKLDDHVPGKPSPGKMVQPSISLFATATHVTARESPRGSPALTETGSSTPARKSQSPETPTKLCLESTANAMTSQTTPTTTLKLPAAKRVRLSAAEKEAKDKEAAERKKEREEKAIKKAEEKAKAEEEKVARNKERDEKKRQKEEEDRIKSEARDEKKRQKEEELRRAQEEKQKKERAQPKLNAFFKAPITPKKDLGSPPAKHATPTEAKGEVPVGAERADAPYWSTFKRFFVKKDTKVFDPADQMDVETRMAKSAILDEFISGKREHAPANPYFNPVEIFALPSQPAPRGALHPAVKNIMEELYRESETAHAAGASEPHDAMKAARSKLSNIPIKVIKFSQDVRPPYCGTVTLKPFALGRSHMRKLARQSMSRRLPLDYEYDSEAEWQEDEEGEDLDLDDDEDDVEEEDDMDGFLDDSEDTGLARRLFGTNMEPNSTGVCFEPSGKHCSAQALQQHKLEMILDVASSEKCIDPFSTSYWELEPVMKAAKAAATPAPSKTMPPPPAPANAFAALDSNLVVAAKPDRLVKDEILNDVKTAILANRALSKVGIIDFIFHQFRDRASRTEVKNTVELVAEKRGTGRMKEWTLKPGHEVTA